MITDATIAARPVGSPIPQSQTQPTRRPLTVRIPALCRHISHPAHTTTGTALTTTTPTTSRPRHQAVVPQLATTHLPGTSENSNTMTPTPGLGLYIPNVRMATSDGWKDMVRHWADGAPELGLETPLKDWPREWLTGANHCNFTMKHHYRSVIAKEFLDM